MAAVVVACSSAPGSTNATTTAQSSIPSTAAPSIPTTTFARGDLADWEPVEILVGNVSLTVALADEEPERQRGLSMVRDFGGFEGMLFAWNEEVTTGFWMKETPIPLDLFFFGANGAIVDQTSLAPCQVDPCPIYVAEGLFRWVLESPAGSFAPKTDDRLAIP
ncbi:MAG: DUF192 domain-containing protein [Acidimicrobiia bacterium]